MKKLRIAVIEDKRDYWVKLVKLIESLGDDFEVEPILVGPNDSLEGLARTINQENLDMLLLDELLNREVKGPAVLKEAGGKWFKPGMAGGNPRVISISSEPTSEMQGLCFGCFTQKHYLLSAALAEDAGKELIQLIQAAALRIKAETV